MKRICVFCGSNPGKKAEYIEAARSVGSLLAAEGIGVVYGGGSVGMMGELAAAARDAGGEITGVIPRTLLGKELPLDGLTSLHVVSTMHERKALMSRLSEAFIALPGGLGTLEEFFEVLTWAQLGMHRKPCGLLDVAGYYHGLIDFFNYSLQEGFVKEEHRSLLIVESDPTVLLQRFKEYQAPAIKKWISGRNV